MRCDCLFRQDNEPEGFMNIDADGLICVPENVAYQAEFLPLLSAVRARFEQYTADLVHSVYVYGSVSRGTAVPKHSDLDLTIGILPFRPSEMLALAVNGDYHQVLVNYAEKIEACETGALSKRLRREAARKVIRSTKILRTETDVSWPSSLDEHAERFQALFPEKADEMQYFLMHAQGTTAEADDFVGRLIQFADWMDQIRRVN